MSDQRLNRNQKVESSGFIKLNTWLDFVILLAANACVVCIVQVTWHVLHNKLTVDTADRIVMFGFLYPPVGESLLDTLGTQSPCVPFSDKHKMERAADRHATRRRRIKKVFISKAHLIRLSFQNKSFQWESSNSDEDCPT